MDITRRGAECAHVVDKAIWKIDNEGGMQSGKGASSLAPRERRRGLCYGVGGGGGGGTEREAKYTRSDRGVGNGVIHSELGPSNRRGLKQVEREGGGKMELIRRIAS